LNDIIKLRKFQGNSHLKPCEHAVACPVIFKNQMSFSIIGRKAWKARVGGKGRSCREVARLLAKLSFTDDGCGLEEPMSWGRLRGVDELKVFEKGCGEPRRGAIGESGRAPVFPCV
jgi:hypothetical protein